MRVPTGWTAAKWHAWFPPAQWLREYRPEFLGRDIVAGVTLAAYAIPVSLAYATLAGLPPQVGVYGYLLGGLGYALFGSSRQLAIGPTSAISLMIAGTVADMAGGDAVRYGQIASLAGFTVGLLCLLAWALRLSALVKLISDSILDRKSTRLNSSSCAAIVVEQVAASSRVSPSSLRDLIVQRAILPRIRLPSIMKPLP